ncbi:MAG: D-alanine--D-alanine ligase [Candidatus Gracilibacteria bacterium]|jgi:D-alanine-D-alanine ligase|nr:D-alanine--D-alanine ligase [Candidatus Gracilibacteria bacterium]
MKKNKTTLAIVFGGKSAEHEVSIISAQNIARAIDKNKYNLVYAGIDKEGILKSFAEKELLLLKKIPKEKDEKNDRILVPKIKNNNFYLHSLSDSKEIKIDVVFPVLHGTYGEDGTFQGLCKMFGVPFVGSDILSSSVCMDKDFSKRLLRDAKIPVARFVVFNKSDKKNISFSKIKTSLGLPFFVKPANLGSSVGISKVKNKNDFSKAIEDAFIYDNKIIIEEFIDGREVECSVLGNDNPICSVPGEILPTHDFYSYEAKYLDQNGARMEIPAKFSQTMIEKIQNMAIKAYKILGCEGMGRVDFFITKSNKIYINEINTIPGFTSISMYPKLFSASGIQYSKLIDKLIALAIEKHKNNALLKTDF